jgi:hypothetical protein
MHAAEEPGEWIADSILEAIPGASDTFVSATVGHKYTVLGHLFLLLVEEFGIVRPVWQDPEANYRDKDRDCTFDEDCVTVISLGLFSKGRRVFLTKPLPGMQIGDLVHVFQDSRSEETRNDVRDGVAGMPDGHASWVFFLVVP